MRYFHLSEQNLGPKVKFRPRIPKSRSREEFIHPITGNYVYEDDKIRRISVSNAITGCLRAVCASKGESYFVYETFQPKTISRDLPLMLVPDAKETGERWILSPAWFYLIGEIDVLFGAGRDGYYPPEYRWTERNVKKIQRKPIGLS